MNMTFLYTRTVSQLNPLASWLDLAMRLYVAQVFLQSGWVKIQSWDATLALFEYEYAVPLLSPVLAAWLGTVTELVLPPLLALGLLSRPVALALFVFNVVAAVSYPDISAAGIKDHQLWGLMLLMTVMHGPGRWSLDKGLGLER